MSDFSCEIDETKIPETMNQRFNRYKSMFPQLIDNNSLCEDNIPDDCVDSKDCHLSGVTELGAPICSPCPLKIYLFENICEEYESTKAMATGRDWLNYCGIDIDLKNMLEETFNIQIKTNEINRKGDMYEQFNPIQPVDESVKYFLSDLLNFDFDIPYKYLVCVSHSHYMKHLLLEMDKLVKENLRQAIELLQYEESVEDVLKGDNLQNEDLINEYNLANVNKILLDKTIGQAKQNVKKPGKIYFNNLDILGIVRLKIPNERRYMILDTFILQNHNGYEINSSLSQIQNQVRKMNYYKSENINIILLTRHCVSCHNILKGIDKVVKGLYEPGCNRYSMCIPDNLVDNLQPDKMNGLISSIKKINEIYYGEDITYDKLKQDIIFGSSFIFRSILTSTILARSILKELNSKIQMDMRRTGFYSTDDLVCDHFNYSPQDLLWIDAYNDNESDMNTCEAKYLKYHGSFKEVHPDDTFESYFDKVKINPELGEYHHYENIDRYSPYVKMCNAKCSYTDIDKDRIDFKDRYA